MAVQRNQTVAYVPSAPAVTASSQDMESRPTFAGQTDSLRLVVFFVIAAVCGAALFLLASWPVWASVVAAFVAFAVVYALDTAFATGYLHKAMEQATERRRIEAALAQNQHGDAAQQTQIELLLDAVADLQDRLAQLERHITIVDRTGSRTVAFADETDTAIRQWLRDVVFAGGNTPAGVYPNGQIASAMPFKDGSDGYRRLQAAGLCSRNGNGNYVYVGPATVLEALQKLQKPQA